MVLGTSSIFGHFILAFSGCYFGRSLSGGYMMRLTGMGIVDPVYATISQRCFYRFTAAEAHVSDHLDRRDRIPHHMENLLGDRVPNVMAG